MKIQFRDRRDAGRALADYLGRYSNEPNVKVLALPRGGVPVGFEVALHLKVPLGIFLVRKLGAPEHEEFAMGAVASGGLWFVNDKVVKQLGIARQQIQFIVAREQRELERRAEVYGTEFSLHDVRGQTVILIDDGVATGSTMHAAVIALNQQHPEKIIIGVPVASASAIDQLRNEVTEIFCVRVPEQFQAVGEWYEDFSQTSDDEVRELLEKSRLQTATVPFAPWPTMFTA